MNAEPPLRVQEAEKRRAFRRLLEDSSLGCPLNQCEHLLSDHGWNDLDDNLDPIDPECSRCRCGADQWSPA